MYPCLGLDLGQYAKLFCEFGLNCNYHDWWLPAAENLLQCYGCWTFGQSQNKGQPVSTVLPWFEGDMKDCRTGPRAHKGKQKCVQSKRHSLFKISNIWWNQAKTGILLRNVKHTYFCVTSIKYQITSTIMEPPSEVLLRLACPQFLWKSFEPRTSRFSRLNTKHFHVELCSLAMLCISPGTLLGTLQADEEEKMQYCFEDLSEWNSL